MSALSVLTEIGLDIMEKLIGIAYASTASTTVTTKERSAGLAWAEAHNAELGVSAVALFYGGTFMCYMEGGDTAIDKAFTRVRASELHHGIFELFRGPIPEREFEGKSFELHDLTSPDIDHGELMNWLQPRKASGDIGRTLLTQFVAGNLK